MSINWDGKGCTHVACNHSIAELARAGLSWIVVEVKKRIEDGKSGRCGCGREFPGILKIDEFRRSQIPDNLLYSCLEPTGIVYGGII